MPVYNILGGDILFRWVNNSTQIPFFSSPKKKQRLKGLKGDDTHRQIIRQQKFATESIKGREKNWYAEEGFAKFTDTHIIHVAIVGKNHEVWEVRAGGLKTKHINNRPHFDWVVRFEEPTVQDKITEFLSQLKEIRYIKIYPLGKVGINKNPLRRRMERWAKKAEMAFNPARPYTYDELESGSATAIQYTRDHMKTPPSNPFKEDQVFFKYLNYKVKKWAYLKSINKELEKKGFDPIDMFVCSHFVNAVLHRLFVENLCFVEALRNYTHFGLNPAQMARQCKYEQGIWAFNNFKMMGIQHKGQFLDEKKQKLFKDYLSESVA